jgi:hypothetical protein
MADRDRIPSTIPKQYIGIYKQVCERQAPIAIAESALRPVRDSAKTLGNSPVNLVNRVGNWLKPMVENSLFKREVRWGKEHQRVDDFTKETEGDLDGIEWASMACHQILIRLEAGDQIQNIKLALYKQYFLNIWIAQFEECIPQLQQHYADADQENIDLHLTLVRPYLEQEIEYLAKQLAKHGNVNSLNLPDRTIPTEQILSSGDIMQGIVG